MTIIDRRKKSNASPVVNRKKFVDRYKDTIKKQVEDIAEKRTIEEIKKSAPIKVTTKEPKFRYDWGNSDYEYVYPGNTSPKGTKQQKPPAGRGQGSKGSPDGDGEDEFYFTLTKEEFIDLYFEGMALPRFVKESIKESKIKKLQRAGFSKDGIPSRINIKKTFEQAIGRRISTRAQGKKPLYLDDTDIRYDYFTTKTKNIKQAVVFAVMDVSGSMTEDHKTMAKKFFLLLYLFLDSQYENITIRFIRHTQKAEEVSEKAFFYERLTGGTVMSSAYVLTDEIIREDYPLDEWNIYVAQVSDGDNWGNDDAKALELLKQLLGKVQYFAYLQVCADTFAFNDNFKMFYPLKEQFENFECAKADNLSEIYPVLRKLFTKD